MVQQNLFFSSIGATVASLYMKFTTYFLCVHQLSKVSVQQLKNHSALKRGQEDLYISARISYE